VRGRRLTIVATVLMAVGLSAGAGPAAGAATIRVDAGGNLQAAINAAQPGDVVELAPGAVYSGNFVLPDKGAATAYITIRTGGAGAALPAAGTRVGPSAAGSLAVIQSPNTTSALATAPGAHHWRLELLEFRANARGYGEIIALGSGGAAQSTTASVPHDLVLDRLLVRGDAVTVQKRGIALNSASTTISNSYVADCKGVGFDSQAIGGWNGPGPYTITNNYLEGAGENFMIGGASPSVPNLVPSDIVFTRNDVVKPAAWKDAILSTPSAVTGVGDAGGALLAGTYYYFVVAALPTAQDSWAWSAKSAEVAVTVGAGGRATLTWSGDPTARVYRVYRGTAPGTADRFFDSAGTVFTDTGSLAPAGMDSGSWVQPSVWSVKNLFELKEAQRVLVDGNLFENVWNESQSGYAILFTPRNQDNTSPWVVVRDVTFSNNIVRHAGAGVQVLGYDDIASTSSQRTQGIRILNNVFADIGSAAFPGAGHWLLVNHGPSDVRVEHNTVVQGGDMIYACGGGPGTEETAANFVFANNLVRYGPYGIMGDNHGPGNSTIAAYLPASTITANGIACGTGASSCSGPAYPAGNVFLAESDWQAQFANYAAGDFHLAAGSRFAGAGTDGTSIGANVDAIDAAHGAPTSPPPPRKPANVHILIK
jgi:hypothetical protein